MTSRADTQPVASSSEAPVVFLRGKKPFPVVMTILTVLVLIAAVLAQIFISEIDDVIHLGLDVIMVLTIVVAGLTLLLWFGWILSLSGWTWTARLAACFTLLVLPIVFFKVFRPIHGGDTNLLRFDPIWSTARETLPTDLAAQAGVDLTMETPADFPRFLGSNQNGEVNTGIAIDPKLFSTGTKIVWKQPVGLGWSGFAARNGFAVTMEQRAELECVTCYSVGDGKLQWIQSHPARHLDTMNLGRVGPRSTPTIHNGYVYAVGAVGQLVCLNGSDGTVVWEHDLNALLGITLKESSDSDGFRTLSEENTTLAWGRAGAPLIVDEMVVVPGGGPAGEKRATLLAFDLLTGELRWKGGQDMIAYGSPVLKTMAGRRQILMTAESLVIGFDPEDGKVLWSQARPGESGGAANTSQVSVVSDSDVLISKGYPDGGGERLHLEERDGQMVASSVWNSTKILKTKLTSPVVHDGYAYSLSNGFMECARLSDGRQMWKRRGRFGHGQVLLVGHHILLHSETGELFLLDATPDEYRELGTVKTIDGVCWNTLCLTGKKLLVRSEIEAACVEIPVVAEQEL